MLEHKPSLIMANRHFLDNLQIQGDRTLMAAFDWNGWPFSSECAFLAERWRFYDHSRHVANTHFRYPSGRLVCA